jgi:ADP-ribose pyrophosphatase YjhB (NUDIX family)
VRFCSACGAELESAPPVDCRVCGRSHWRNAKPGASGLVVRDGRLLLVRRAHDPWRDLWCAPSGFCDGDEHPIRTAEREILEEAGIRARVVGYLGTWVGDYGVAARAEETEYVSVAYYHAEALDDEPGSADGVESSEVRWFASDEIPGPEQLAPPDRFPAVLDAWRAARRAGLVVTPLPDRPAP